jgi:hypothetical protein
MEQIMKMLKAMQGKAEVNQAKAEANEKTQKPTEKG